MCKYRGLHTKYTRATASHVDCGCGDSKEETEDEDGPTEEESVCVRCKKAWDG